MPKRSLQARWLTFRQKGVREELAELYPPSNLRGSNLIDLFEGWCSDPKSIPLLEKGTDDCVHVNSVELLSATSLLIDTNAGKRGVSGILYSGSGETISSIAEDDAPTGHTRAMVYVPDEGLSALLFSEYCQRGTAGTRLLKGFNKWFNENVPSILMQSTAVLEEEDWLEQISEIKSVSVSIHGLPEKAYQGLQTIKGSLSVEFKPEAKRFIPFEIIQRIRKDPLKTGSLLGVPEIDARGDLKTRVEVIGKDGRRKTIDLLEEKMPVFLRTLNNAGEPELSNAEFVEVCEQYAIELLKRLGE